MSKPKTGKAIMTDEELYLKWLNSPNDDSDSLDQTKELMKLIKLARQQGIAESPCKAGIVYIKVKRCRKVIKERSINE